MGERRTRTHPQDLSPTHIPQQNTRCVIAPFVFCFRPLSHLISISISHIIPLIPTPVLTFVTHPPLLLRFLAFAAVHNCCEWNDLPALWQIFRTLILEHSAKYLLPVTSVMDEQLLVRTRFGGLHGRLLFISMRSPWLYHKYSSCRKRGLTQFDSVKMSAAAVHLVVTDDVFLKAPFIAGI